MWSGQVFKYGGLLEQVCSRECSCKILVSRMLSFRKGHNEPTRWDLTVLPSVLVLFSFCLTKTMNKWMNNNWQDVKSSFYAPEEGIFEQQQQQQKESLFSRLFLHFSRLLRHQELVVHVLLRNSRVIPLGAPWLFTEHPNPRTSHGQLEMQLLGKPFIAPLWPSQSMPHQLRNSQVQCHPMSSIQLNASTKMCPSWTCPIK